KLHAYQRSEADLTTDLGGVPVSLTRAYDSGLRDRSGAFGFGWRLVNGDTLLQTDVAPTGREALGVFNPFLTGTRLYVSLPDGRRVGFTFSPQQHDQPGVQYFTAAFTADAGNDFRLDAAPVLLTRAGGRFFELLTGRPYHPSGGDVTSPAFTLTAPDGTHYDL